VGDFHKKTIKDVELSGKTVLVRSDLNVPVKDGKIVNDFRIKKSLPTLQYLIKKDCKVVVCSHLGRPKNAKDKAASLKPVADRLSKLLGQEVWFSADCVGEKSRQLIRDLPKGSVLLLENLRFHEGEEANDDQFAGQLAEGIDWFVQDGFGVVHREHASTVAITNHLKGVAGLLLESEINTINETMDKPERPLFALIGGAKISDKIDMLKRFIEIVDAVAVGGAMANTFLLAQGIKIGKSVAEPSEIPIAKEIIAAARAKSRRERFIFYIPQDGVVAKQIDNSKPTRIVDWGTNAIAEIENYPKHPPKQSSVVADDELILDIGPFSGAFIAGTMQLADTVIWNGAMGVTETPGLLTKEGPYSQGTELVVEAMLGQFGHRPKSLIGGGDTVSYIESQNLTDSFDHVSTGGGASMQLMSGKTLPGVEALQNRDK
jgi:3-phosphoglycerate kinase